MYSGTSFCSTQHPFGRFYSRGVEEFRSFYRIHNPRNQFERIFIYNVVPAPRLNTQRLTFQRSPWSSADWYDPGENRLGPEHGHQGWGPVSEEKILLEIDRLTHVQKSISEWGYHPDQFDGHIWGVFLIDDTISPVRKKFLVTSGYHRAAFLVHSEWSHIPVALDPRRNSEIKVSAMHAWPGVEDGSFTPEQAQIYAQAFFRESCVALLPGWSNLEPQDAEARPRHER